MRRLASCFVLISLATVAVAESPRGYYRFPALHGDTIVFTAEGDLWKASVEGGVAQRLTTHPDEELHAAISPDGKTVAFSASYEGPTEVYTMPLDGGLPTRETWHGRSALVVGWTPAGEVLYATRKFSTLPRAQLVTTAPGSGVQRPIPLAQAAEGSYDARGDTLFFARFAKQGSHTKRYKGGTAQDIWRFTEGADEARPLTPDYSGTSRWPMAWNGRVYFATDRDGTMNVWSMDPDGGDLRQHTRHDGWDVLAPAQQGGRIVYQNGADLWLLDLPSGDTSRLDIRLASDFDQMRERWIDDPMDYLTAVDIAPDGKRVALTARGEVFVAPVKHGRLVALTRNQGVRYRQAMFLDDDAILALSDESGEVEWWKLPASGIGKREQVTRDGKVLRFSGEHSPDGKWVAHYDHDQELWLTELASGKSRKLDFSPNWGFDGPAWSPDSRWLAWARPAENTFEVIHVHNVEDGTHAVVTSDRFDSWSPAWSPDGKWLYFLSDRHFRSVVGSPWGARAPEPFFDRQTHVYALPLSTGLRSPFRPPDELATDGEDDDAKGKPEKEKKRRGKKAAAQDEDDGEDDDEIPRVEIELNGIRERLIEVPVPRGNLDDLYALDEALLWESQETIGGRRDLVGVKIDDDAPKPKTIVENFSRYRVSDDGEKLLVQKGNRLYVVDAKPAKADLEDAKIDLGDWAFPLQPREEWRQMFVESWRLERDYFYDRGMHGVDWQKMLDKYLPLVERVTSREELSDLQAQMAGELSALHIFVRSGETRDGDDDVDPASLGARLVKDTRAGGWRVEHVYRADPDYPDSLAPLARPGVNVPAGSVITAINGVSTLEVAHPAVLLRHQTGKQVRLAVRSAAGEERDVIVHPISAREEAGLRYTEWEYTRRQRVEEASGGDIGYLHLRAMGRGNMAEWYRDFYPVFNRKGLILDMRHNRGGNIDSWILERLLRRAWFYWQPRVGEPYWNMQYAFRGHLVMLIDESTASDGEAVSEGFRRLDLGKLIGTRTWGGEIWLTSSNVLVDRGIVTAAEFGVYGPEGKWLIEGHGVDPDIEVDNLPHATFNGEDAQLEAAIGHLERLIEEEPRPVPAPPDYPDLSVEGNR